MTLLRQRAAEKDRTLESSAAKIAALEAALAEENTQNDSSGTSAAQLDFVLAESEARASALQDRVAETEKELEATRAERREFEARAGTLMKEVLALSKREAHREQELMSASRERDEARSSLIALKKECDQVRHRCDALESGNANKDAEELAEVRKQAEALLASQSEFENQISVLVKERDEARAKYADIQHRCDVLESGNANKDAEELAEVRKQAGALLATQSEFENQISLLVKERDEARAECAEVRHRCDALESGNANKDAEELAEVRKQAEALLATQSEFENEISLLVKERDEARAECADASRRCDALMSEHREAHDGLKGAEEQLQDAVRRRDAAVGEERKAREELRAAQEEISSLRDIIAERERELELNAGRLSDLAKEADQRRLAEREEASIALERAVGEVAEMQQRAEMLMEAQRQLERERGEMMSERDDARAECAEALRRCESLINEQRAACADRDDISHQLREAVCSRDAATEEGSRVRAELAVAQQEISSLREIVAEREQQLESDALRASKTIEEATQGRLAEREESKTLIEAGEKRLSEAEEYINALMAKNADLNNEILALGNDRDEARAYVEATTARVQELQLKISCLEDDMQMERQRVREAKAEKRAG